MNELVGGLGYAVKNWWMSLLLGLLYIAVALCLLFAPVSSYVALSVIFSISILVSGILEVFFAAGNKKTISSWGWYLAGGIIDLLIGIYLVFYPLVSMELIPFIVAFWLMFRGFIYIVWLFHRFETLWHKGLGVVSGVWHSGYSLLYGYHLATWTWCCYRALYAVHHFSYYRMFPCHFLLRVEKIA